jgi:hypothetical protein
VAVSLLPYFYGDDIGMRVGAAGMATIFARLAMQSGQLKSPLERYALAVSFPLGMAVLTIGLIAHFL